MSQEHVWVPDPSSVLPRNAAGMGDEGKLRYWVHRCRECGCIRISDAILDTRPEYKPAEWPWVPFKALKTEPPCKTQGVRAPP